MYGRKMMIELPQCSWCVLFTGGKRSAHSRSDSTSRVGGRPPSSTTGTPLLSPFYPCRSPSRAPTAPRAQPHTQLRRLPPSSPQPRAPSDGSPAPPTNGTPTASTTTTATTSPIYQLGEFHDVAIEGG